MRQERIHELQDLIASRLTPQDRRLIEASRFLTLATAGPEGLDCSPRGDEGSVVRVRDDKTLLMPDRRGNDRIDSLRNIVRSELWNPARHVDASAIPTPGELLATMSDRRVGGAEYDEEFPERARKSLW